MSSYLASRQAATAEWAQRPVTEHDEHIPVEQLYTNQNDNSRNSFKPASPYHPAQDIDSRNISGATSIPSSIAGGSSRQPQGARLSSNTLQPSEVASPAFSFDDYLTPEFSSDNLHSEQSVQTTPSIPELKWQETHSRLHNPDDVDPILYHDTGNTDIDLSDTLNALDYTYSAKDLESGNTLDFGPDLPTHDPSQAHLQTPQANLRVQTPDPKPSRSMSKRSRDQSDGGAMSRALQETAQSIGHLDAPPMSNTISPSVLISTYSRGDSPARAQFPMARSLSKRSQSSRLGEKSEVAEQQHTATVKSHLMPPNDDEDDTYEEDEEDAGGRRSGLAPVNRDSGLVPSLKDLDQQKELNETLAGVEHWLATSEAGSPPATEPERSGRRDRGKSDRLRSRSTGARVDNMGLQIYDDSHIPGPNVLIEETSEYYYSDDSHSESAPDSPPAQVDTHTPADDSYFPPAPIEDEEIAPDELEPLPKQFFRRTPWEDPARVSEDITSSGQPPTSNAAMVYYDRQAAKFETASRAATWGTRRRLSDGEIASIIDGSQVSRHLSLKDTLANRARARGSSIINSVKKSMEGRSNSFIKQHLHSSSRQHSPEEKLERVASPEVEPHRNSTSSISRLHRMSSSSKRAPKSPPLNTGGAFMAMTSHLAAVGGGSSAPTPEPEQANSLFSTLKRHRSRSDISKSPKPTYGMPQLFTQNIGPSEPVLASPLQVKEFPAQAPGLPDPDMEDDAEDDEVGIKMEMPMQALNIIPNLDGFKAHVRQLNPRLEPFLVDRIATDQLRRFKKLLKNRAEHMQAIQLKGSCPSGPHCHELGGKATMLPPRHNSKDTSASLAQFKVAAGGDSDADEVNFVDGVVTPALFPPGIPLPPTKTLPAEFECFLCFQVKKFQKPSDWTKHVHEDVQPFSCTFPHCPEPKSFKRKADWVRHENERHRHLEWWKCSIQECNHVCYRKDNFVQHLVREHKMTEPKSKGPKPTATKAHAGPSTKQTSSQTPEDFWHLVESCRHETPKKPKDEPCKFCNNRCNTWKKLSVHVGKHMEQIAMPVLDLAKNRNVTAETVVSPIDAPPVPNYGTTMLDTSVAGPSEQYAHSPYTASAHSTGHSPAVMHADPQVLAAHMAQNVYQQNESLQSMPIAYGYDQYGNVISQEYISAHQGASYTQPQLAPGYTIQYQQPIPRSLPMETNYIPVSSGMLVGNYNQPQFYNGANMSEGYMQGYGPSEMVHEGGMRPVIHSGHSSHGHTPVSGVPGGDESCFYQVQQPGPSGQNYYG